MRLILKPHILNIFHYSLTFAACPALEIPNYGSWLDPICTSDVVPIGTRCELQCVDGFQPYQGVTTTTCHENQTYDKEEIPKCTGINFG